MEQIEGAMKILDTPCFILDDTDFALSIQGFREAMQSHFTSYIIGYSVKTNSLPYCLKRAGELGCYAEVVSYDEYNLALLCGFPKSKIIYNGPMKSKETFIDALEHGAIVNIETKREIDWLSALSTDKNYAVGIRLNVDISTVFPEESGGEYDRSRFGFATHTGEFEGAIQAISLIPNVKLGGLHIHRTSKTRSPDFYRHLVGYALQVIEQYKLDLHYLDIGGGYYGIMPGKPTYQDYARSIASLLNQYEKLSGLTVIIEPGNAVTASAFSYLSSVIDVKLHADWYTVTTDGTRNDIDPLFHKTNYFKEIYYAEDNQEDIVKKQLVTGCTCLEFDRIFELNNERLLQLGDRIYYKNVGAYTLCLSPLFIRYIPHVYVKKGTQYTLVREKWTEKEYVNKSVF